MPSASLHFRLPEDDDDFQAAQNGQKYRIALERLDTYLRNRLKYGEMDDDVRIALQAARSELHAIANEVGVEIT